MDTITHGLVGALIGKAFFADAAARNSVVGAGLAPPAARQPTSQGWPLRMQAPGGASARVAVWAATLGALFPDSDIVYEIFSNNNLAVIEQHRGFTHSFVCLPLFALALAAVTRWCFGFAHHRWPRRWGTAAPSWRLLTVIYAAALASHILLDLITSFGTMIWSPLVNTRATWDLVFIIDVTFTAIVLTPQAAAWVYRQCEGSFTRALAMWVLFALGAVGAEKLARTVGFPISPVSVVAACGVFAAVFFLPRRNSWGYGVPRSSWCRAGVIALAAYLVLCAAAHAAAVARVAQFAASRGLTVERLAALPLPPSPKNWSGLIRTPEGVYRARIHLLEAQPPEFEFIAEAHANGYIEAARQLPKVKTFLWFARFPVVRYAEAGRHHVVEFTDLRFTTRGMRRRNPFTFRVTFDNAGRVVEQGWVE